SGKRYDSLVLFVMVAYSLPAWALWDVLQHPGYAAFFIGQYTTFGYTSFGIRFRKQRPGYLKHANRR
ncbi:MAG: hypothetical protein QGG09_18485, partial [Pirellulaceae bacterium]|nr:hypothetical protein [Pirellulaceae bacterium]